MLRLITLGRIDVTDAHGRPVESIRKRPKRLALLTYLAVAGEGVLRSRDTVMGLFWPEDSQARARQSLNQALYVLRRALGHDVVISVGNDQIGLAPGGVWCDAVALRSAVASGDQRSAQAHYRGEFLPGFFLSDAPDFEKWLDGERATLRRLASSSAWKLATEAAAANDVETAAAMAARSAELSLREEAAVRRAIELLDGLGERARALDLYRELESDLAEDLGTRPAPETQEVVARVLAREPTSEVTAAMAGAEARARESSGRLPPVAASAPGTDAPVRERVRVREGGGAGARHPWRRAGLVGLPVGAAVLLLLVWLLTRPPAPAIAGTAPEPHLLIEPFGANTEDAGATDLAGAITQGVAAQLAQVEALHVLLVEPADAPSADSAALALETPASPTRAWFIVRGRVMREGDSMRATVSLVDRVTGQVIGSASIERVTSDPLAFVDAATEAAARFARAAVGRELREREWRASTRDVEAWRLLERAETNRFEAIQLMRRGAGAAAATSLTHADSLLARAEELAPRWLPPPVLRAQVAYQRMWASLAAPVDLAAAQRFADEGLEHAGRALALDSTDARALEQEGILLYWLVSLGGESGDAALAAMQRAEIALRGAVSLDARRAEAWRSLSAIYYDLGRHDDAYHAAQQAYAADAFLDQPHDILVRLFNGAFEAGDDDAARVWCTELREQYRGSPSGPLCALTLLGWVEDGGIESVRAAEQIVTGSGMAAGNPVRAVLDLHYAVVLARSSFPDSALAVLSRVHTAAWNPELVHLEAAVRLALGEADTAAALLRRYLDENPAARGGIMESRRFAALRQ